jgi:predicted nucleotidyltransferase
VTDVPNYLTLLKNERLLPSAPVAVLVVGSAARGWDHGTSDVDLVVVTTEPMSDPRLLIVDAPLDPPVIPALGFHRGGRRYEVKYWTDSQVDQLLAKVSWESFEGDRKVGNRMAEVEQLFLERLLTCVPLLGEPWVSDRIQQVHDSAFRAFVITFELAKADAKAEAAIGLLEAGDAHGAVLTTREAFGHAVDALLTGAGEFGALAKWRPRRFRVVNPPELGFDEYWSVETMSEYDPERPELWVSHVVTLCKKLAAAIEI